MEYEEDSNLKNLKKKEYNIKKNREKQEFEREKNKKEAEKKVLENLEGKKNIWKIKKK